MDAGPGAPRRAAFETLAEIMEKETARAREYLALVDAVVAASDYVKPARVWMRDASGAGAWVQPEDGVSRARGNLLLIVEHYADAAAALRRDGSG